MTNDNPFASFCLTTPDATATAEMTSLANYETTFGVRQVDSYTFPGASVGLTSGFEGSLDGMPATVTAAGLAGPFSYLNGPVPIDNYDPNVSESYGYLGVPAPAAGQTFTPLVDAAIPGGTTRGSLAGVFSDGSRQQLVLTFLANAYQTYFQALAHGIITWATNGVHLGYSRNYFSVVVDDLFSDDSQWSTAGHCTPGEDCPIGSTITTPNIRMVPADVTTAATWEATNNFRFTFAFNGEASDSLTGATPGQAANTPGLVDDPLTDALLANKSAFDWINHTYSHLHLGCVQNVTVRPWVCETTDGLPVNCPSVSNCNILWQTAADHRARDHQQHPVREGERDHDRPDRAPQRRVLRALLPAARTDRQPELHHGPERDRHQGDRRGRVPPVHDSAGRQRHHLAALPDVALVQRRHRAVGDRRVQLALRRRLPTGAGSASRTRRS